MDPDHAISVAAVIGFYAIAVGFLLLSLAAGLIAPWSGLFFLALLTPNFVVAVWSISRRVRDSTR